MVRKAEIELMNCICKYSYSSCMGDIEYCRTLVAFSFCGFAILYLASVVFNYTPSIYMLLVILLKAVQANKNYKTTNHSVGKFADEAGQKKTKMDRSEETGSSSL